MTSPITIVVPVYNREYLLQRTLDSIACQSVAPAKIVLVDNASSDSSLEMMHRWAEKITSCEVKVCVETKKGAAAARNGGLREGDSDFVMFFDSDDVMLPGHVADFTDAVRRHPDMDILGRSIMNETLDGRRKKLYFTSGSPMFNHLFRACLATQRFVVRTSLVRSVGAWDESLAGWDDYELGVRLLLASDKVYELPGAPSVITYSQVESLTGTSYTAHPEQWEGALDLVESHFRKASREDMLKWIDARRMILAAAYAREKSFGLSDKLRSRVLDATSSPRRMNLVYYHNLYFNRLTWLFAKILFAI